jgi:hypothetical protein
LGRQGLAFDLDFAQHLGGLAAVGRFTTAFFAAGAGVFIRAVFEGAERDADMSVSSYVAAP